MAVLRALIIEDSEDDAELLLRELKRGGYDVVSERVQTAIDMAAALRRQRWEIIFSDWSMPQFSALDALAILQNEESDIPLVIVSGTVGEDVAVEALRNGAHDFFSKGKLLRLVPAVERELRDAHVRRERAQMREQLMISDRMASVGILAAGVAHEINNPLASVLGNLDLAQRDLDDLHKDLGGTSPLGQVLDEVRDAQESAERIRNIANDLKLFARSDDERSTAVDVRAVVESSLRLARNEIRHRARLRTTFSPVPPVDANASRLGQVMLNLIVNAAQSIPEGRAEDNEIELATMLALDGRVVVEVRDTGSGMSAEVRKQLFTPFFTTKPMGEGTGLGLSICHRIVSSFGGAITVDSEVGKGSVFRVHLLPAKDTIPDARPSTPAAGTPPRRGAVLVVDDEQAVGTLVHRVLEHDHDVTTTTSAQEALEEIAAGRRYDVILCDLMMPHLSGMDLHAELSRVAPEQANRMIFLTGGAFTARAREFFADVRNPRVEKPFDITTLRAIVNDHVGPSAAS